MDAPERAEGFVPAGLAALGIEASEEEMAAIEGVHGVFWPPILELLALDTSEVEPESGTDFGQAPK